MPVGKIKPTEMKIENLNVVDFFDERFVGLLKKKIGDVDFEHFCIYVLDEKREKVKERLSISHETKEDEQNNLATAGATNPDTLEKFIEVIVDFKKK
ncbi:MAG TPA: hypothetical protein VMT57_06045 [Candidatus Thermoplasmatota archaeon]|nr:hypothetical protein [Candidatus Thermoplasmatota archaeon]